jgi:hypothetical protein
MTSPPWTANPPLWIAGALVALPLACNAGMQVGAQSKVSVTLHEPVIAQLVLWNASPAAAEIDVGQWGEKSYRITVTRPNGEQVVAGKPLWAHGAEALTRLRTVKVEPAQSYTRSLLLNEWFAFDGVSPYEVSIAVPGVDGVASFEVDVLPRDENRLRGFCERLAKDETEQRWTGDLSPARVLSFVADDIAIPYLVKIGSAADLGSGMGVEGLVRIGDLQAVSALASFPQGNRGLLQLLGSTGSEPVRAAIKEILAGASQR